ncbi:hypothetical protein DL96DRAFT_542862 [Flagelloscypha sp. PMI_526]|nr:hypothetical protein DL96DRAFT_542862 [Flagelloscypha sp. PMI_526]
MTSTVPHRDIPLELLISIAEYALGDNPGKIDLPLLLISKGVYHELLPKFYHTIESGSKGTNRFGVDRAKLLSANPASLLHVRYLKLGYCDMLENDYQFMPFANLTHLALWGIQGIGYPDAQGIPFLPLEELVMWSTVERDDILRSLTVDCTLSQTLKRFASYDVWSDQEFEGLQLCHNLTHILVFYSGDFEGGHVRAFLRKEGFLCWLVLPARKDATEDDFAIAQWTFHVYGDPRIVIVKNAPEYLYSSNATPHFWKNQSTLWEAAERQSSLNSLSKSTTVVDELI